MAHGQPSEEESSSARGSTSSGQTAPSRTTTALLDRLGIRHEADSIRDWTKILPGDLLYENDSGESLQIKVITPPLLEDGQVSFLAITAAGKDGWTFVSYMCRPDSPAYRPDLSLWAQYSYTTLLPENAAWEFHRAMRLARYIQEEFPDLFAMYTTTFRGPTTSGGGI